MKSSPDDLQKHLRHEIVFKKQLNGQDFQCRPSLYKVNRINAEEMVTNLTILLSNEDLQSYDDINLPSYDDMINILQNSESHDDVMNILQDSEGLPEVQSFTFHQPLAIKWNENGKSVWYLGFYLSGSMDDDG